MAHGVHGACCMAQSARAAWLAADGSPSLPPRDRAARRGPPMPAPSRPLDRLGWRHAQPAARRAPPPTADAVDCDAPFAADAAVVQVLKDRRRDALVVVAAAVRRQRGQQDGLVFLAQHQRLRGHGTGRAGGAQGGGAKGVLPWRQLLGIYAPCRQCWARGLAACRHGTTHMLARQPAGRGTRTWPGGGGAGARIAAGCRLRIGAAPPTPAPSRNGPGLVRRSPKRCAAAPPAPTGARLAASCGGLPAGPSASAPLRASTVLCGAPASSPRASPLSSFTYPAFSLLSMTHGLRQPGQTRRGGELGCRLWRSALGAPYDAMW